MFQSIADWLSYSLLNLSPATKLGESVNYFFYDIFKIYVLILLVVGIIAFIRTFLPPHEIKKVLVRQRFGTGNILASLLGAVTPFCSCSSIPLFIGFLEAEVPLGIAFSFIITSPLVNEVIFILIGGTFGWKIAFLYALSGIVLGVIAGIIIGRLKLEKEVLLKFDNGNGKNKQSSNDMPKSFDKKLHFAINQSIKIFKKLWWIIAIGVGIGAAIHGNVPQTFLEQYLGADSILAIPIAVLVGIPIYAGGSAMVPIAFALTTKGIPLGTALAFMMSIAGLSLPEAIMLKRILSLKLLGIFFGMVAIGILVIGYLFNFFAA